MLKISSDPSKSKAFIHNLNTDTINEYKQLHGEIETVVKSRFKEVMQGFVNQSQHYLNELSVQLENQFGIKIEMLIGKFDLDTYSPFYLRDIPEHNITQPQAHLFSAFLPKKTIHKRFVKTVMTELDKMIVSNSAAMLYDISYRMDESLRKVNTDLNKKNHQIISQLLNVLNLGKEEKLNKEADVKRTIEQLEEDIGRLCSLK